MKIQNERLFKMPTCSKIFFQAFCSVAIRTAMLIDANDFVEHVFNPKKPFFDFIALANCKRKQGMIHYLGWKSLNL